MRAADYADRLRDTKTERELVASLRRMPQQEVFAFVLEMLDTNLAVGLNLANKVLTERRLLRCLLDRGLSSANASSIRFWLESLLPRLGFREVVRLLRERLETDPVIVGQALYFLPSLGATHADLTLAEELRVAADAKKLAAGG